MKKIILLLVIFVSCAEINKTINYSILGVYTIKASSIPTPKPITAEQFLLTMYNSPGKGGCKGHYFIRQDDLTVFISEKARFHQSDSIFILNKYSCDRKKLETNVPGYHLLDSCNLNNIIDSAISSQPEILSFNMIPYSSTHGNEAISIRLKDNRIHIADTIHCVKTYTDGFHDTTLDITYCLEISTDSFRLISSTICSKGLR